MASRSKSGRSRKFDNLEDDIPEEVVEDEPQYVVVALLKEMNLRYTGEVTGNVYVFNGAGSIQNVNIEDWEIMRSKKGSKDCCKSSAGGSRPYFEQVS